MKIRVKRENSDSAVRVSIIMEKESKRKRTL